MKRLFYLFLLFVLLSGCVSLGNIKKTNDLLPGMTMSEVKCILGQPSQTQFIGDKLVWKYNLHQYWKGWVPYYLAFDKESKKLDSWFADEQEYFRNQKLWLESMPKKVNIDANVHQEIQGNIQHDINIH